MEKGTVIFQDCLPFGRGDFILPAAEPRYQVLPVDDYSCVLDALHRCQARLSQNSGMRSIRC